MVEILVVIVLIFIVSFGIPGLIMWFADSCKHSYERIDSTNDKNMILVCRKCGKIKKLRK